MVARPGTDQSAQTRISNTKAQLDELSRRVGEGAVGLKDGDGNTVQLLGGDYPALGSRRNDAALTFNTDGSISARNATDDADAPLTAGGLTVSGSSTVAGDHTVGGTVSGASVSATGTVSGSTISGSYVGSSGDIGASGTVSGSTVSGGYVHSSGGVAANGNLSGGSLNAGPATLGDTQVGDLTAGTCDTGDIYGLALHGNTLSINGVSPSFQQIQTYDLTATHNIACGGTIYGTVAPSERKLKDHVEDLGDPWAFIEALKPSRFTWKDQGHYDDRRHVGVYVDEMAEADPDTVEQMPEMPEGTFGADEGSDDHVARYNANIGRRPDERALIAYLVRAAQDLHEVNQQLQQQIDELRAQVVALAAKHSEATS